MKCPIDKWRECVENCLAKRSGETHKDYFFYLSELSEKSSFKQIKVWR